MPNQHITHRGPRQWAVVPENGSRATAIYPTQAEAIDRGREIAINQQSELFIHDRHNRIRDRDSFGNDPANRPG